MARAARENDCVLPGGNGTVFIGGHTGTYFSDLARRSSVPSFIWRPTGATLPTKVTDMQVIQETDVDKVRWGAEEPSCILYTCYPFGILTHTPQRYASMQTPSAPTSTVWYRQRQPKIKNDRGTSPRRGYTSVISFGAANRT